ncbi:MAG: phosphatidate cytidylyltransferase [Methylococcaceae bacterium]
MLLQRIITASILASLIVLAVLKLSSEYLSLLLGFITLLAAWEWSYLAGVKSLFKRGLFLFILSLPMLGIHFWTQILELVSQGFDWPDVRSYSGALEWLIIAPVLFWILMMILIRNAPQGVLKLKLKGLTKILIGGFILLASWMFLSRLRSFYGAEITLYLLILIWAADISAYFTGKKFGKTKLSPDISPGKTVEGMYGALVIGIICGIVLSLLYGFPLAISADFVLLSALTVLISIYGDLFFSVVKRQKGVKDSGSLLPGHGGILDRIDSLVAAAPIFYAGVFLIYRQVS